MLIAGANSTWNPKFLLRASYSYVITSYDSLEAGNRVHSAYVTGLETGIGTDHRPWVTAIVMLLSTSLLSVFRLFRYLGVVINLRQVFWATGNNTISLYDGRRGQACYINGTSVTRPAFALLRPRSLKFPSSTRSSR